MKPEKITEIELVSLLRHIANCIEQGDSFGGTIQYEIDLESSSNDYLVTAMYRVGNREGQGGYQIIGELNEKST